MLTFIDCIPSRSTVSRHDFLNLLGGAANDGEETTAEISVWGRIDVEWKPLITKSFKIAAKEHKHLYFTLEPKVFSSDYWGERIEEIELVVSDRKPPETKRVQMVFIN